MQANLLFGDIIARLDGGIKPQSLATGTTSGSAIPLIDSFRNLIFRAICQQGTASAILTMYLQTATASSAAFTSISTTVKSIAVASTSLVSAFEAFIDTSDVAFADLGTGPLWVQPVITLSGAATAVALDVLGYNCKSEPAYNFNGSTTSVSGVVFTV
jgi:hypothetical protein